MWKVPENASRGSTEVSRSLGSRLQQHVHLELGALGGGGRLVAGEARELLRRGVHEDVPGRDDALAVRAPVGDLGGPPVRLDAHRLVAGGDHDARVARRRGDRVRQGAHAADRHVPGAGAAADHVVEEAAVLPQGGVVGVREGPDEGVGEDDTADEVVGEVLLHGGADRLLEEHPPRLLVVDTPTQLVARGQRLGERREHPLGDAARSCRRSRCQAAYSPSDPVSRANASRVRRSPPPTSSPVGRPSRSTGVYEETVRPRTRKSRPRSRTIFRGSRLTRYE